MGWAYSAFIYSILVSVIFSFFSLGCGPSAKNQASQSAQQTNASTTTGGTNPPPVTTTSSSVLAPNALVGLAASAAQINLSWNDNSTNETYFKIERAASGGGPFAGVDQPGEWYLLTMVTANQKTFQDTGLLANTAYFYRVSAVSGNLSSVPSEFVKMVTQIAPSAPPTAPSNQATIAQAATIVQISWNDNSTSETAFIVERSNNNGATFSAVGGGAAGATSFRDINLLPATTYTYRIKAINGVGASAYTPNANVTTLIAGDKTTYTYIRVNILEPNCVGCHGAVSAAQGIRYDSFQAVSGGATTMAGSINANRMPPGNPLTADQKSSIGTWINNGRPNN